MKSEVGVGTVGLTVSLLGTALLFLIPDLMAPAAGNEFINTWSFPIMMIGEGVRLYGLPLLSAEIAYYLMTQNHSAKSIVVGSVVGGLVLGVGTEVLNITMPYLIDGPAYSQSLISHVLDIVGFGGRLVIGAVVGTVCAIVVEDRL